MSKRSLDSIPSSSSSKMNNKRRKKMDDDSSSSSGSPNETDWKPVSKVSDVLTVHERMLDGVGPREILEQLVPHLSIDANLDDTNIWQLIVNILTEPPVRSKLPDYNTMDDAIRLLKNSSKILVLTGAGVSVSCGIPDFRSRNGIYARLRKDFPDLPSPEAMFDLEYFRKNPKPFYEFAREIFPGQYKPSLCHRFVKELETRGKLLRNYTQNIDVLENIAGIERVLQCHGSFATASCCACKHKVDCSAVKEAIFEKTIPRCPNCPPDVELNVMKPDIIFFGEDLPGEFHEQFTIDKEEVDLLIVIGSSLKVRPVALVPNCIPNHVPQILINREPLDHLNFDIELLGNCDSIISELCCRLGEDWTKLSLSDRPLRETICTDAAAQSSVAASTVRVSLPSSSKVTKRSKKSKKKDRKNRHCNLKAATAEETSERTRIGSGKIEDSTTAGKNTVDLDELRKMYKPRLRNLANDLENNTYLFVPPSRYVFSGAEVFVDEDEDEEDDSSSAASTSSSSTSSSSSSSATSSPATSSASKSGDTDRDHGRKSKKNRGDIESEPRKSKKIEVDDRDSSIEKE